MCTIAKEVCSQKQWINIYSNILMGSDVVIRRPYIFEAIIWLCSTELLWN